MSLLDSWLHLAGQLPQARKIGVCAGFGAQMGRDERETIAFSMFWGKKTRFFP